MRWLRMWRLRRRINRVLDVAGWPVSSRIFSGSVVMRETVYAPGERLLTVIGDADVEFPRVANFLVSKNGV